MTDDADRARSVLDKLYTMAMHGDVAAAGLFLDHVRGVERPEPAVGGQPRIISSHPDRAPDTVRPRTMMSVAEAAEELGLSTRTVVELAKKGQLPVCRIGRRVLVRTEELQRFIRDHSSHAGGRVQRSADAE